MLSLFYDIIELLYPIVCATCGKRLQRVEDTLCIYCSHTLATTDFHLHTHENPMAKQFWGRLDVQHSLAWLWFNKGSKVQRLLHLLKYKGREDVGYYCGKKYARFLQTIEMSSGFDFDLILPVPIHPKKKKKRGYNQCDSIAEGLSDHLSIPWADDVLVRHIYIDSQTKKGRLNRIGNTEQHFGVCSPDQIRGKHILLVDDVVTTGATIEACVRPILAIEGTRVSIFCIAYTQ